MVLYRDNLQDTSPSRSEESDYSSPPRSSRPAPRGNQLFVDPARAAPRSNMPGADRDRGGVAPRRSGSHRSSGSSQTSRDQAYHGGPSRGRTGSYAVQPPPGQQGSYRDPDGPLLDPYRRSRVPAARQPVHTQTGNDVRHASGGSVGVVYRGGDPRGHASQPASTSYTGQDAQSYGYAVDPHDTGHSGQGQGYAPSTSSHGQYGQPQGSGGSQHDDFSSGVADDGRSEPVNSRRTRRPVPEQPSYDAPQQTGHTGRREVRARRAIDDFDNQWSSGSAGGPSGNYY